MLYKRMLSCYSYFSCQVSVIDHSCFPVERKSCLCFAVSDSVKSPHEIQMPGCSSELSVCEHFVSCCLLFFNQCADFLIFYTCQLFFCNGSCFIFASCLFQSFRTQKASYIIISKWCVLFCHCNSSSVIFLFALVSCVQWLLYGHLFCS